MVHPVAASWLLGGLIAPSGLLWGVGIPITYGHGERIEHVASLPPDLERVLARELGVEVSIGFAYSYMHVYQMDLWTWHGRHVLYHGERYWEPGAAAWQRWFGSPPQANFGKPLRYRFPLCPTVVGFVLLVGVPTRVLLSRERRERKLRSDPRFRETLAQLLPEDPYPLMTQYTERQFESAVASLMAAGIAEHGARRKLQRLVTAECSRREREVNRMFESVARFLAYGPLSEGDAVLEQLSKWLAPADPRQKRVSELQTRLHEHLGEHGDWAAAAWESPPVLPGPSRDRRQIVELSPEAVAEIRRRLTTAGLDTGVAVRVVPHTSDAGCEITFDFATLDGRDWIGCSWNHPILVDKNDAEIIAGKIVEFGSDGFRLTPGPLTGRGAMQRSTA